MQNLCLVNLYIHSEYVMLYTVYSISICIESVNVHDVSCEYIRIKYIYIYSQLE